MSDQITVHVTKHGSRKAFYMYYDDPITGKREWKSSRQASKAKADKVAGKWEDELRSGRYKPASAITWEEFRDRYENEVVPSLALGTAGSINAVFNSVSRIVSPLRLSSLTAE